MIFDEPPECNIYCNLQMKNAVADIWLVIATRIGITNLYYGLFLMHKLEMKFPHEMDQNSSNKNTFYDYLSHAS